MNYYKLFLSFLCLFFFLNITAQLHDAQWIQGWWVQGKVLTDFRSGTLKQSVVYNTDRYEMSFNDPIMCDSSGNLLFYTHGNRIYNREHKMMPNADSIGLSDFVELSWRDRAFKGSGLLGTFAFYQNPNISSRYEMIHLVWDNIIINNNGIIGAYDVSNLQKTVINMDLDNGLGDVVSKNEIILDDTLAVFGMSSTKHANGRDWWIVVQEGTSKNVYVIYYSQLNEITIVKQELTFQLPRPGISGGAEFSPDGNYYARTIQHNLGEQLTTVELCKFDRVTGGLSDCNYRTFTYSSSIYELASDIEFSPNSKFLYLANQLDVFQFDLNNDLPLNTIDTVAHWERRLYLGLWHPILNLLSLAPDGKIYVSPASNSPWLGVINKPNMKGVACHLEQYAITTPIYDTLDPNAREIPIQGMPDPPYYRLGPLDGSTADTLGYDNHPVAWFREELGPNGYVYFTDLSYYEPSNWQWWFGDGKRGSEQNPDHQYEASGVYEVCLEVSNQYSSHEFCKEVEIIITDQEERLNEQAYQVSPSIIRDQVVVLTPDGVTDTEFLLYDVLGKLLMNKHLRPEGNYINTASLGEGIYFYYIVKGTEELFSGKLIKL